jgi:hypothetical protein
MPWKKAIGITHSECVFVAFFIQHAKRMRRIILSSGCTKFFQIMSQRQDFQKEKH